NTMAKEKCIILSTHILEEVDAVCNRVIIIAHGKLVSDDRPENLRKLAKSFGSIALNVGDNAAAIKSELQKVSGVESVEEERTPDGRTRLIAHPKKGQEIWRAVLREADAKKWTVEGLALDSGQLDEVFRALT